LRLKSLVFQTRPAVWRCWFLSCVHNCNFLVISLLSNDVTCEIRRSIGQAVSRWSPTAAARVRAWVWSCGICGGLSSTGAGFLRILRFPLPILIPPTAPHPSSGPGTICQIVADVPSGLSLTPPQSYFRRSLCRDPV
jgi:hypothetical protein